MAKKSVSQEMMEECRPNDPEYKCVFSATRTPHLFSVLVVWFWYHLSFITDTMKGCRNAKLSPNSCTGWTRHTFQQSTKKRRF